MGSRLASELGLGKKRQFIRVDRQDAPAQQAKV